jgi:phage-related tail protein
MASRKDLKKSIKFVSLELATECFIKFSYNPKAKEENVNAILDKIGDLDTDLIARVNHTDGKENRKVTKNYYKKLIEDWNKGVKEIIGEIEKLGK